MLEDIMEICITIMMVCGLSIILAVTPLLLKIIYTDFKNLNNNVECVERK